MIKSKIEGVNPEEHIKLVHACCQRFRGRGIEYDDIFQAGCMGLVKASKKFDKNKGVQFSTYAVPVILGEIKTLFQNNVRVKVSRSVKNLNIKIKSERERYLQFNDREPSIGELAEKLGVTKEQILEALEIDQMPVSLTLGCVDFDEDRFVEFSVPFDYEKIHAKISVRDAIEKFKISDKNLIYLRFFKGKTQSETAQKLGMTQVQVSRREKYLINELRKKLA